MKVWELIIGQRSLRQAGTAWTRLGGRAPLTQIWGGTRVGRTQAYMPDHATEQG
jgi:hypothetical protein